MAVTWSIEPQVQGVTISNGTLTYQANTLETSFTVKYDDGQGCSGEYVYRIPEGCGNTPPPAPDPPEPPGPEPPGPGPEPGDTCDDFTWQDGGYSWCEASEDPGWFCSAWCSDGNLEKNVSWGNIDEESDSFFTSFSDPVIETSKDGVEKWIFRGMVSAMNCDCSSRTCHVTINYTIKGISKSHRATITQRGWPKNAEHCP